MRTKPFETEYKNLLHTILEEGLVTSNRTGIDTMKIFNYSFNIDLAKGFPILTGKKMFFDKAYHEYMWMREGMTTTKYLNEHGIHWWDKYAKPDGDLGRTYGYQMRCYNGSFDQLSYVIKEIMQGSRRAIINMWNACDLEYQSLPCCYISFNFVRMGASLNMTMNFRSSDTFLGLPYDIVVGALLLIDVANFTGLIPRMLGISIADAHIYGNHLMQVDEYLKTEVFQLPKYDYLTRTLVDYKHGPFIKAKLNE